jgi:HlyD family secretion protein
MVAKPAIQLVKKRSGTLMVDKSRVILSTRKVPTPLFQLALAAGLLMGIGCAPVFQPREGSAKPVSTPSKPKAISAQGRLLPALGIIQISATPGDRIEEILVEVNQHVTEGQVLARMRSEKLRAGELDAARTKLAETRKAAEAKRTESQLGIDTARGRLRQAESQLRQATEQKKLIETQVESSPTSQVAALQKQIETFVALRKDPITRPMIGAMELEARQMELNKVKMSLESSMLGAAQAAEAAQLAVAIARDGLTAAEKAVTLVEESFPTRSLEKQIELLELQVAQSPITAPSDGMILSLHAEAGELSTGLPAMELANLEKMICIAEVHEADIGQLAIGDVATIHSSALERSLQGRIRRIDSLVGMPQMRSPNPMARTDFRAVPIVIELDEDNSRIAAKRIQLQVDVSIQSVRSAD